MQWSPQQESALKAVDDWYKNRNGQQVFYIAGFAGTGKTTLARHFAQNIKGEVRFATFTGKAAHVMRKKGCEGATTIHKMIYRPKMASKEHLELLEKQLADHLAAPSPDIKVIRELEENIRKEQENVGRMSFSLNLESDLRRASLLILDEASMVSSIIGKDLESFGVPILVLGDPEQLPPIYGAGYFTEKEPNILLNEIHRQALDNPIIAMSKLVREGKSLNLGTYGNSRVVAEKLESQDILDHNIILTGLRKTKKACDDKVRKLKGMVSLLPQKGDTIMCVKNNHMEGLLNGQVWDVKSDGVSMPGGTVNLHIQDQESGFEQSVRAYEKPFFGEKMERYEHDEFIEEFEYAYAITVHKSQGSQWNSVLLFDQKDRFPQWSERDRRRWLYTGITRAAEKLTVIRL
jgi:exodeoxyribonuclease V